MPAPLGPEITIGLCETRAAVSMGFGPEGMGGGAILVVRGRERWRRRRVLGVVLEGRDGGESVGCGVGSLSAGIKVKVLELLR